MQRQTTEGHRESPRLDRARQALALFEELDPERRDAGRERLFVSDFVLELPARGGCQVWLALERGEFLRSHLEVTEQLESGPRVLSHVRLEVLRRYTVDGEPCTQPCSADGIVTYEFRGDRIARAWSMLRWR